MSDTRVDQLEAQATRIEAKLARIEALLEEAARMSPMGDMPEEDER